MSEAHDPSKTPQSEAAEPASVADRAKQAPVVQAPKEIGGRGGLDPVRYGDWEKDGRCIDF